MAFGKLRISVAILLLASSAVAQPPDPPYAVDYRASAAEYVVVWYCTGVNVRSYVNDQGEPNWYHLVMPPDGDGRVLVEFANVNPDLPVDQVSLYIWGKDPFPDKPGDCHSPFELAIYGRIPADTSEVAGWGPYILFADDVPIQGAWVQFPIHRRLSVDSAFYVQFRWLENTPMAPLPTLDYMSENYHTFNGCNSGSQVIWSRDYNGNLLLRLSYNLPDTLAEYRLPANAPDSFAVYLAADSNSAMTVGTPFAAIRDSLHLTIPRTTGEGNYLTVVAFNDGKMSQRSRLLYLDVLTAVPIESPPRDFTYILSQNHPNPFNGSTVILSASPLPITIYNLLGQTVAVLPPRSTAGGAPYLFIWNARDWHSNEVASGVYLYGQDGAVAARKMLLLK